ncbi:hypothetical protein Cgig2_016840 [Carnegiea gigantea]|uniref:Uncharacterized protein n=1 Tax=Carnegiea gigantea TaxID=171969 RepID=A0A9Q1GX25_9CARY|nr:hypothetical protein Cgig2_016840 [Carnegiea gigantea]
MYHGSCVKCEVVLDFGLGGWGSLWRFADACAGCNCQLMIARCCRGAAEGTGAGGIAGGKTLLFVQMYMLDSSCFESSSPSLSCSQSRSAMIDQWGKVQRIRSLASEGYFSPFKIAQITVSKLFEASSWYVTIAILITSFPCHLSGGGPESAHFVKSNIAETGKVRPFWPSFVRGDAYCRFQEAVADQHPHPKDMTKKPKTSLIVESCESCRV